MSDQFVAEIRIFGCNFPPSGWAQCNGQLMPLSQNTALFSLLGTVYGGDGKSTFALPNLQGSAPMHPGEGAPGLSDHYLGQPDGTPYVTLLESEMPIHTHNLMASAQAATQSGVTANSFAKSGAGATPYIANASTNLVQLEFQALTIAGGSLPHNNMQPYLVLNFCIALQGIFPARP